MDGIWEKSFTYNGKSFTLDASHILLDAGLKAGPKKEARERSPYLFSSFEEILKEGALKDGTRERPMTVYIAPSVYWIKEAGDQETVRAREGSFLPYEKEIRCEWLSLEGLGESPREVVLAADKGQAHGCIGNYTMFHFIGDGLHLKNLTIGNYCNVDLVYDRDPALSRKKRTPVITQAQLGDVEGDFFFAEDCHFISRLNLYPICGAKRSLYARCHFECTDDALNGNAVYQECDFDFYGGRPLSGTDGTGCAFLGCRFRIIPSEKTTEPEMYFIKNEGSVTLVNCDFEADRKVKIGWKKYHDGTVKCYDYQSRFNGKNFSIGTPGRETVSLEGTVALRAYMAAKDGVSLYNTWNLLCGNDGWDPLDVKEAVRMVSSDLLRIPTQLLLDKKQLVMESGRDTCTITARAFYFYNEEADCDKLLWSVEEGGDAYLEIDSVDAHTVRLKGKNTQQIPRNVLLTAHTEGGLSASAAIVIKPFETPAPLLKGLPKIENEYGKLVLRYELEVKEGKDYADCSEITWFRRLSGSEGESRKVSAGREGMCNRSYELNDDDLDGMIMARIVPKTSSSRPGEPVCVSFGRNIERADIAVHDRVWTDFSTLPLEQQPEALPGYWLLDFYEPVDKSGFGEWRKWISVLPKRAWGYGELGNGCVGKGLYPVTQGTRLFYVPRLQSSMGMKVKLTADPAKTAGQGFGSAGQYMDVCVKFHVPSMTGYALRIKRTVEASDAVAMFLVSYKDGTAAPVSEQVMTGCFRTGFQVELQAEPGKLSVRAYTKDNRPCGWEEASAVKLEAQVPFLPFTGFGVVHTGTSGDGGWQNTVMLHEMEIAFDNVQQTV